MKRSTGANLSLAVSLLPAALLIFAMGVAMGDPPTPRSPEQLREETIFTNAAMIGALVLLLTCGWLSGYGYSEAPYRSLCAMCLAAGAVIAIGLVL